MDVVFLDLDGVLNSTKSLLLSNKAAPTKSERDFLLDLGNTYYKGYPLNVLTSDLLGLDRECIKYLNMILEATRAKVVITSSWRYSHPLAGLQKLLENRGLQGELIDITPVNFMGPEPLRGYEIQSWLDSNPKVKKFVILDDNGGMAHLKRYLVKTSSKVGLTEEDARKAVSIVKPKAVRV